MENYLDKINSPADIKNLNYSQLKTLCAQIRERIIKVVSNSSGHLASNLGIVEMTVAIHRVFDCPNDKIIFDVGHQCYVHKLLTGRRKEFDTLRTQGGISGFTKRSESIYDCYGAGHSGTSFSAAIGFATSEKLKGSENYTICVVGDGAYTGGSIHEALNNVDSDLRLIIIINENEMSISKNVGNMAKSLSKLRSSRKYLNFKHKTEQILEKVPIIGIALSNTLRKSKSIIKRLIYHTNYFEDLGISYLGPCDGNNLENFEIILKEAKRKNKCCIIHAKTIKGAGFEPALQNPEKYHSFSKSAGSKTADQSFSSLICKELCEIAKHDKRICVTTAAMGAGTGVKAFEKQFPQRYFDVGIAEEHAVIFCAGLAADGMLPVFAVYSTFLQRTYDFLWHEFSLQKLPFVLLIDRAGFACEDGATHHGIYDVSMLYSFDGTEIYAPAFPDDVKIATSNALKFPCISAIRYSKELSNISVTEFEKVSDFIYIKKPSCQIKRIIITYGRIVSEALKYCENDNNCLIILLTKIKPINHLADYLKQLLSEKVQVVFLEEGIKNGGAFMVFCSMYQHLLKNTEYKILAIDCSLPEHGILEQLYLQCGISCYDILKQFEEMM